MKPLGLVSCTAVKRMHGLQVVKNQSENKEMVKNYIKTQGYIKREKAQCILENDTVHL